MVKGAPSWNRFHSAVSVIGTQTARPEMEPVPYTSVVGRFRLGVRRRCPGPRDRLLKEGAMRFVRSFERGWRPALVALLFAAYPAFPDAQTTSASVSGV